MLNGDDRKPMYYFPNTPNTSAIIAEADRVRLRGLERSLRESFFIAADAPIILFAGRLIDAKRPLDVLEAFEQLKELRRTAVVVMVGDGPLKPALMERAKGNVVFTGWIRDRKQMAALMAISRQMCCPQYTSHGAQWSMRRLLRAFRSLPRIV